MRLDRLASDITGHTALLCLVLIIRRNTNEVVSHASHCPRQVCIHEQDTPPQQTPTNPPMSTRYPVRSTRRRAGKRGSSEHRVREQTKSRTATSSRKLPAGERRQYGSLKYSDVSYENNTQVAVREFSAMGLQTLRAPHLKLAALLASSGAREPAAVPPPDCSRSDSRFGSAVPRGSGVPASNARWRGVRPLF